MSIPVDVEKCAARPIDIRQAATPDGLLADLRARLATLEDGVLRLAGLAEVADASGQRRYAVLAASGAREVDAMRRRIDRLQRELEAKATVDALVGGGESLSELLGVLESFVSAHDAREAREAEISEARREMLASGHREDDGEFDDDIRAKLRASAPKQRIAGEAPRPAIVTARPYLSRAERAEAETSMPAARARAREAVLAAGGVGGPQIRVAVAVAAPGTPGGVA